MAPIKDNYIESQNLMKLSYEIENFDLGDRKEKILKLFSKIQLEILNPLSNDFFQANNALKRALIQQRNALRVKGYPEKDLRPFSETISLLSSYAEVGHVKDQKDFLKVILATLFVVFVLSAVFTHFMS
ncbi:hypothetical protein [Ewingella americana]|uniref:hypothetical protein n=1 Tax=Ewingella americana TaxID=41202 RepID=UPI0016399443|nr:hypothetical protein [Ewingella americana]QMV54206.1 hypothetical protein GXP68_23325 [Ewingella americana]